MVEYSTTEYTLHSKLFDVWRTEALTGNCIDRDVPSLRRFLVEFPAGAIIDNAICPRNHRRAEP